MKDERWCEGRAKKQIYGETKPTARRKGPRQTMKTQLKKQE